MALPYLKLSPEEALQIIDECIVSGYQLKDKINNDYFADKNTDIEQRHVAWNNDLKAWTTTTIQKLESVFVSPKELYNFRDATTSPYFIAGTSQEWNNINNTLVARIAKLNQYDELIHSRFTIHFEWVGRDKIVQHGQNSTIEIKNK